MMGFSLCKAIAKNTANIMKNIVWPAVLLMFLVLILSCFVPLFWGMPMSGYAGPSQPLP